MPAEPLTEGLPQTEARFRVNTELLRTGTAPEHGSSDASGPPGPPSLPPRASPALLACICVWIYGFIRGGEGEGSRPWLWHLQCQGLISDLTFENPKLPGQHLELEGWGPSWAWDLLLSPARAPGLWG